MHAPPDSRKARSRPGASGFGKNIDRLASTIEAEDIEALRIQQSLHIAERAHISEPVARVVADLAQEDRGMTEPLPIIVAEWPRNSREVVRVILDEYQGCQIIDVRCWWYDNDGKLRPGKSGINLAAARHLRPLAKALADALTKAEDLDIIESPERPEGEV